MKAVAVIVALALQTLFIPAFLLIGGSASGADLGSLLSGASGLSIAFWMRVLVGLALPLVVAGMTWQCCRIRSLQSATGLLYVAVALVLAGEIASKLLLVLTARGLVDSRW